MTLGQPVWLSGDRNRRRQHVKVVGGVRTNLETLDEDSLEIKRSG